jgi:uncharacterized protein
MPLSPVRVYGGSLGTKGQEKVVVFVSEFQPAQEVLKTLAITMMDWVEDHKCKMVISPEGLLSKEESARMEAYAKSVAAGQDVAEYVATSPNNKPSGDGIDVLGVGSTPAARQMLKQIDVKTFENGVIAGLAGVLLNEGVARDFDVITLLSEAHAEYPDARAAAAIMTVIDRMLLHVELDLKPLLQEAALIENTLKDIQKRTISDEDITKKKSSYMYG